MAVALDEGPLMVGTSTTVRPSAGSAVALIRAAFADHPLEDGAARSSSRSGTNRSTSVRARRPPCPILT